MKTKVLFSLPQEKITLFDFERTRRTIFLNSFWHTELDILSFNYIMEVSCFGGEILLILRKNQNHQRSLSVQLLLI